MDPVRFPYGRLTGPIGVPCVDVRFLFKTALEQSIRGRAVWCDWGIYYWSFVREIHRSPVDSPHKSQWRRALIFSLICAWTNSWVNNRDAGVLSHHDAYYDVTVMWGCLPVLLMQGITQQHLWTTPVTLRVSARARWTNFQHCSTLFLNFWTSDHLFKMCSFVWTCKKGFV